MTTHPHTLTIHLVHDGPTAAAPHPAGPDATARDGAPLAATAACWREAVWQALAEAITYDCILCFDPATGWGHWATAVPGREPVFLGFVRVDPSVAATIDLEGSTLVVHRRPGESGFRVAPNDRHPPQWNTWRVSQTWTRNGLREAELQSGLRTALARR